MFFEVIVNGLHLLLSLHFNLFIYIKMIKSNCINELSTLLYYRLLRAISAFNQKIVEKKVKVQKKFLLTQVGSGLEIGGVRIFEKCYSDAIACIFNILFLSTQQMYGSFP